ncbi:hypothetical protein DFH11DRAFT_1569237 [Phellopilus nigrolimitatus]|nr:hypothetical protein DFH11DRAFT_1569237 [Phellopilus nigrolimitatus]
MASSAMGLFGNSLFSRKEWIDGHDVEIIDKLSQLLNSIYSASPGKICSLDFSRLRKILELESNSCQSIRATISWIKDAQTSLKALSAILDNEIRQLESQHTRLVVRNGIESLPNEVLAIIAEYSCYHDSRESVRLSHICRRFRTLALDIPALWTSVSPTDILDETKAFLERSKFAGLHIRFSRKAGQVFHESFHHEFLAAILPHAHRWHSFSLYLQYDAAGEEILCFLKFMSITCGRLELPTLKELSIQCDEHLFEDRPALRTADDLRFYENWIMPNIQFLKVYSFLPRPIFVQPSLRSLRVELESEYDDVAWDLGLLLMLLSTFTALEDLTLSFRNAIFVSAPGIPRPDIVLESLRTLDLYVLSENPDLNPVRLIMAKIRAPNLNKLVAATEIHQWADANEWLHTLLYNGVNDFMRLTHLDLQVNRYYHETCEFETVFQRLPNLAHLSIEASDDPDRVLRLWSTHRLAPDSIPPLRSLRFSRCGTFYSDGLDHILKILQERPDWDEFHRLEVIDCPNFCQEDARIIPKNKVVWRDK